MEKPRTTKKSSEMTLLTVPIAVRPPSAPMTSVAPRLVICRLSIEDVSAEATCTQNDDRPMAVMLRIIGPSKRMNLRRKLSLDLPRRKYASTSTVVTV